MVDGFPRSMVRFQHLDPENAVKGKLAMESGDLNNDHIDGNGGIEGVNEGTRKEVTFGNAGFMGDHILPISDECSNSSDVAIIIEQKRRRVIDRNREQIMETDYRDEAHVSLGLKNLLKAGSSYQARLKP